MENKVLITGATGATGSSAIKKLIELNIPVRALVHKFDERSEALAAQGVEVIAGDLTDFNAVSAAMKGISKAYFVYPVQSAGLLEASAYFAQAAQEEKLSLVVNMSQRTARREAASHAAQGHWIAERLFDRSGVPVTHLRPTLFQEWLMYFAADIKANNRILSGLGDARYGSIAGEDIGRVVASILANPEGHEGQTYPLFGPVELTQSDIADILSEVLKRKITYVPLEIEAFAEVLKANGFIPYTVQHLSAIAQDFRDGLLEGLNDNVEVITGQKPMAIIDFIRKNRSHFE